jgi:sulfur relay (sulfurtransferase) complex TusBCD TusD component (DsrE family)
MSSILFVVNDAPYGNERAYNALRLAESEVIEGAKRSTLAQLADWTLEADKALVF